MRLDEPCPEITKSATFTVPITLAWIVRVAAAGVDLGNPLALAGNQALRQYEQSMLPPRPEIGHSSSFSNDRCKVSRRRQWARPLLRGLGWTVPLLFVAQVLPSCGSDDESRACNPGDIRRCPCAGAGMGEQTCNEEGSGYDECSCGTGSANAGSGGGGGSSSSSTGGSSSSAAGSSSMPPPAMFTNVVGAPCAADSACGGEPMFCIQASSNDVFINQEPPPGGAASGGPQGGYCSARCTTNTDCTSLDELSACNNALGICMSVCLPGPGNPAAKCGSERAQACLPIPNNNGLGICIPRCTSDAACGPGRFCDTTLFGMCVDVQRPGGGIGAGCTPETEVADCASGLCVQYQNPANPGEIVGSFCSANCTAGIVSGCGLDQGAAGARQGACFASQLQNGGVGDLGYCAPLCDVDADCAQAADGWVCELFPTPEAQAQVGRAGECVPGALSTGGGADAGP